MSHQRRYVKQIVLESSAAPVPAEAWAGRSACAERRSSTERFNCNLLIAAFQHPTCPACPGEPWGFAVDHLMPRLSALLFSVSPCLRGGCWFSERGNALEGQRARREQRAVRAVKARMRLRLPQKAPGQPRPLCQKEILIRTQSYTYG